MKRNIAILCAAVFAASTFVGLASTATAAPVPPIVNTSPPKIFGTPKVGETLIASRGGWTGTYGTTPSTRVQFHYLWYYNDELIGLDGFGQTFTITPSFFYDAGFEHRGAGGRFRVTVTASRVSGPVTLASSAETARLPRGNVTAGTTVLSGRNQVGETLSVENHNWSPEPLDTHIAWFVDNEMVDGCLFEPIPPSDAYTGYSASEVCAENYTSGAPAQYSPQPADVGKRIVAVVSKTRFGFFVTTRRAYAGYTRTGQLS